MSDVLAAAVEIEKFFRARRWRFCLIGGVAVMRWARPRTTEDVDVSLLVGLGSEQRVIDRILSDFEPRIEDAATFAIQNRVLLITSTNGTNIDVAMASYEFEEEIISRATKFTYAKGVRLTTASAEDLVLMKCIADRPRDWQDVKEIVSAREEQFDWDYIDRQLNGLAEAIDVERVLESLLPYRAPPLPERTRQRKRERDD